MNPRTLLLLIPMALAGCEPLGIDDPVKVAERKEAEGRAVGSGCRHAGRSLLECYEKNKKESKAAIFAGWREMDGYMRENKIETVNSDTGKKPAEDAAEGHATGKAEAAEAEAPAAAAAKTDEKPATGKEAAKVPAEGKPTPGRKTV